MPTPESPTGPPVVPPAGRPRPRRGRPGYDVGSLLAVAVTVFNEQGYDRTSMEDLAGRLGITKSAIYHHVASKEQLLGLAVDRALDALYAVTAEPAAQNGPAIDRLEHVVRRSVEVLVAELPYVTLLLRVRGNTAVERRALARRRRFDAVVTELVRAAAAAGDLRPDVDPALAARLIFGQINSISEWWRPGTRSAEAELAAAVVEISLTGLRTHSR
jgi:AcrR family transcriptional regulator